MILNIELLHGATLKHYGTYYTAYLEDEKLQIKETFTGIRPASSGDELAILDAMFSAISNASE
tara:strand:- start:1396 stop:1584 length:189 start_codon:yes stop_codon:yes gene_type:complete